MSTVAAPRHGRPRRRRHVWAWVLGIPLLLVLVFAGLFAWNAYHLQAAAQELRVDAAAAQNAVRERDAATLATAVDDMQQSADAFATHTSGPHWTVAGWIPWVQDQTEPLRQAGESVRAVADDALGPLADMGDLSALEVPPIEGGRIDPHVLDPYREPLAAATDVLDEQLAALDEIELGSAVELVRENYLELSEQLRTLDDLVYSAHVAAELLSPMLGGEGERTYIVMVQNNSEPRATGGIPGAVLELTVDDGRMSLDRYVSANTMASPGEAIPGLTEDEQRIFGSKMGYYPQNVNFTPELPRSAELMSAFWERETGSTPQGVVSVDPVALESMLAGMAPIEVQGVRVTDGTVAQVLLRDSYLEFPEPADQDAFFALASRELFEHIVSGSTSAVAGAETAIGEGRLMVWSADEAEQELLSTTSIAGDFMATEDALGVFINDGSGSKIGYYIDTELDVVDHLCESDGSLSRQTVTMTIHHNFDGEVSDLPWYVSGGGVFVPEGEFHANVLVFPPAGMGVTQPVPHARPRGQTLHRPNLPARSGRERMQRGGRPRVQGLLGLTDELWSSQDLDTPPRRCPTGGICLPGPPISRPQSGYRQRPGGTLRKSCSQP